MNKPKLLVEAAKEFINWVQQDCYEKTYTELEDGDIIKDSVLDEQLLFEMIEFYNQPFKPEMITEYFENIVTDFRGFYRCGTNTIHIGRASMRINAEWIFPLPKTNNDFIHNCIQTGIKLTWKD